MRDIDAERSVLLALEHDCLRSRRRGRHFLAVAARVAIVDWYGRRDPAGAIEDHSLLHDQAGSGDIAQNEPGGKDDDLLRGDDLPAHDPAHDHRAGVQRALRPAVLAHEYLALRTDDPGEITIDAEEAVQIELTLELRAFPDDGVY